MNSLEELSIKYVLDKNISTRCHNYIPGYTKLFEPIKDIVAHILEIGIGSIENGQMGGVIPLGYKTGNSLRCWRDYFINAEVYGIDIYDCILNEPRIHTFNADQSNIQQLDLVINKINNKLDIIIDDGSHVGEHQVISFMHLEKQLAHNGIYVVEDVQPHNIDKFKDLSIFPNEYISYIKNNYLIEWIDTRHILNRADDFLMIFRKK